MSIVQQFENNLEKLKPLRTNNDSTYQDVNDFILINNSNFVRTTTLGERKDLQNFDSTGPQSATQLAAVLHSGLTDPTTRWFNFTPRKKDLADREDVKRWIEEVQDIVFHTFSRQSGGFAQQNHEYFLSLVGYGTSVMWVGDEPGVGVVFQTRHLAEIYIEENSRGFVDTVYREFKFTARQAAQEFGEDNLGPKVLRALNQDPHKELDFLHVVLPKKDFARMGEESNIPKAHRSKDHISVYCSLEDKDIVKTSGYNEMPYIVARLEKLAGEVYGRSPSWNSLSSILLANSMQETVIKSAQKQADPSILMSDDGVVLPLQTFPGGVMIGAISEDGKPLVQPFNSGGRVDFGIDVLEQVREDIRKAFFVDQFIDRQGVQPLTATESNHRQENRLRLIGPQVRRVEDEYLSPLINRVFGLLVRNGQIPDLPDSAKLDGIDLVDLDVEYISPLAFTQRTNQLLSYNRLFANVGGLIQSKPEMLDVFDGDQVMRDSAQLAGIPLSQLRSKEDVQAERDARAEQAQQEQMMAQIQAGADTAATLQKSGISITGEDV